jgi:hypothetical protein
MVVVPQQLRLVKRKAVVLRRHKELAAVVCHMKHPEVPDIPVAARRIET